MHVLNIAEEIPFTSQCPKTTCIFREALIAVFYRVRNAYSVTGEIRRKVYDTLDAIGDRAMGEMAEELERHGLILRESSYA